MVFFFVFFYSRCWVRHWPDTDRPCTAFVTGVRISFCLLFSISRRRIIAVGRRQRRSVGDYVGRTEPAVRVHRRQTHVHQSLRIARTDGRGGRAVRRQTDQHRFRVSCDAARRTC